ncbi:serine/threonine-protein phosphatase, partial [Saccharothrix sp. MB29]|nr:serine/threonine-protein phosphatase [Saccharothrix sp. MB29]
RLRSALRAYALEFADPAEVLGKLDRKASHFESSTMATVAYAVIDTATCRMDLALAGHLPPVLAAPGRPAAFVDAPIGPPIGYALAVT